MRDVIKNAIKEGRLKFGEKTKSHMKVDIDILNVAETNYVEPIDINMMHIVGFDIKESEKEAEGFVMVEREVIENLSNAVSVDMPVKGLLQVLLNYGLLKAQFLRYLRPLKVLESSLRR